MAKGGVCAAYAGETETKMPTITRGAGEFVFCILFGGREGSGLIEVNVLDSTPN